MVNAVAAVLPGLLGENSVVLYQHALPERYSFMFPSVEFIPPESSEAAEDHAGNDVLYYDHKGHVQRLFQKGQIVNTLF